MNAKLFLTDYASYNNGTQFEFGHWIDLEDFNDAEEFQEYITEHFAECDEKSPLPCGTPREETMFTDFEGFPEQFYGESMCTEDIQKIYDFFSFLENYGIEDYENEGENLLGLWNEYCSEQGNGDDVYVFDEEFFEVFFSNNPMEAARAASFGEINWGDDYIMFDGYANLKSVNDVSYEIDETALFDWIIEYKL